MFNTRNDPASVAKAQVDTWFGRTDLGGVFLARDGRAFRIGNEEAERLRDRAECDVLALQLRMRQRAYIAIFLIVILFVAITGAASRFSPPWDEVVRNIGYAIYSAHGVWIFYEAYRYDREVKAARDGIAASMASRVPLPAAFSARLVKANPFRLLTTGSMILLAGFYVAAEFMAHRDVDLIGLIPPVLYIVIVPVVWGLYYLAHLFDRNRGVGS